MIMNMISFRDETIKRIDANANTFVAVLTNQKWSDDVLEIAEVGIEEEKISVSRKIMLMKSALSMIILCPTLQLLQNI